LGISVAIMAFTRWVKNGVPVSWVEKSGVGVARKGVKTTKDTKSTKGGETRPPGSFPALGWSPHGWESRAVPILATPFVFFVPFVVLSGRKREPTIMVVPEGT